MSEAIKEVKKLQAAQQITSTLLPTTSVNTMSSDNDRCFQCQEVGHMACYCPHIWCYDCDNSGHVAMDCPDKIPPSGTPACHRTDTNNRSRRSSLRHPATPDTHAMTTGTDLDSATLNPDPVTTVIGVAAAMTLIEVTPDRSTDLPTTTSHMTEAQVPTAAIMIHPTTDPHLTGTLPEMTADLAIGPGNIITNQT